MTTTAPVARFFQNREYLIVFAHVCAIEKYPPDRINVMLANHQIITLLNDDCKTFLMQLMAYYESI